MRPWLTMVALIVVIGGPATPRQRVHAQTQPRAVSMEESKLRGFIITLVLGDVEGGKTGGTFTQAATKALADLKDFLPYKSYRLLDTVWMLGLNGPHQFPNRAFLVVRPVKLHPLPMVRLCCRAILRSRRHA